MVERFLTPIPEPFLKEASTAEYFWQLHLWLDDISRPEGVLATSEETTETVLTQGEKLDLMTVTQAVNLDTVESQAAAATTALASLLNSLPDYNISNDGTVRTLNADDAAGTISTPVGQAEVENIHDAVLVIGDVLSTVIRDLKNKGIFGV